MKIMYLKLYMINMMKIYEKRQKLFLNKYVPLL
jgi:hypothetical protein